MLGAVSSLATPALAMSLLVTGVLALDACAAREAPKPVHGEYAERIELPLQPTAPEGAPRSGPEDGPPRERSPEASTALESAEPLPPLPVAWRTPLKTTVPFAKALARARREHRLVDPAARSADAGLPTPEQFEHLNAMAEIATRSYADAYFAPDVNDAGRLDALEEASRMLLTWAVWLDEVGLTKAPATYRTSAKVALTFEDVVVGPAKRWRGEGLALLRLCVERARETKLAATSTGQRCAELEKQYARVLRDADKNAAPAGGGCACDPGDPLCSSSMNGWCKR